MNFVENKTVEDYFETTHLKVLKFTGSLYPKNLYYKIHPDKTYRIGLTMIIFSLLSFWRCSRNMFLA